MSLDRHIIVACIVADTYLLSWWRTNGKRGHRVWGSMRPSDCRKIFWSRTDRCSGCNPGNLRKMVTTSKRACGNWAAEYTVVHCSYHWWLLGTTICYKNNKKQPKGVSLSDVEGRRKVLHTLRTGSAETSGLRFRFTGTATGLLLVCSSEQWHKAPPRQSVCQCLDLRLELVSAWRVKFRHQSITTILYGINRLQIAGWHWNEENYISCSRAKSRVKSHNHDIIKWNWNLFCFLEHHARMLVGYTPTKT